ncbi:TPA: hypothetical protein QCU10_003307 [Bacillus anthracis]|uniref:hypothetical protein n=1 Tax=Bacillus anthracis TaxID=1392 RepID=UPI0002FECFF8|nr:hypothetical protein [Bacillus cereus]HDR4496474.1 hypothetical protein [Bacillus cereus biovar anthracis]HDR6228632.1 hypothetical protein [Bacillus cereus biovar anthracis]HDR6234630.1 hypothetical protein [Bacillus cereus biovar anthracis]HDR6239051.1 hypothetical protein [Bacillus cereus biovar anthracis]HDR6252152.1 hypothetical protein [Bacillus cereus biovar anthracis]
MQLCGKVLNNKEEIHLKLNQLEKKGWKIEDQDLGYFCAQSPIFCSSTNKFEEYYNLQKNNGENYVEECSEHQIEFFIGFSEKSDGDWESETIAIMVNLEWNTQLKLLQLDTMEIIDLAIKGQLFK